MLQGYWNKLAAWWEPRNPVVDRRRAIVIGAAATAVAAVGLAGLWWYRSCHKRAASVAQQRLERFNRVFVKSDLNKDGVLDAHELRCFIKMLYVPTDQEVRDTVAAFDTDKDGKVSYDEFERHMIAMRAEEGKRPQEADKLDKAVKEELKRDFDALDADRNGYIDGKEVSELTRFHYAPPAKIVNVLLDAMDLDNNKQISRAEFIHFMGTFNDEREALQKVQSAKPVEAVLADPEPARGNDWGVD